MTKKPRRDAGTMHPSRHSIGSNSMTSHGQAVLLKQLGEQMKGGYAEVVNEPIPDHLRVLLDRIDQNSGRPDEEDH